MPLEFCFITETSAQFFCIAGSTRQVLVIAPGFGFLANPQQLRCVEAAGFTVIPCYADNPEAPGFHMPTSIKKVLEHIALHQPDALLCASKGGAYMVELWHTHSVRLPSIMINAHPWCWTRGGLPKDTSIVLVQGSEEEVWPKERGYTVPELDRYGHQKVVDGVPQRVGMGAVSPDSLEELIRTGSPARCYLYYTLTKGGIRERRGDSHNAKSLLEYECLPRLIDSVLTPFPPFHFPTTSVCFRSAERLEQERVLGFEPRSLRRFWASTERKGMDPQRRFDVAPGTEEYNAVLTIFQADPAVESFYNRRGEDMSAYDVDRIERIENGLLHEGMDAK